MALMIIAIAMAACIAMVIGLCLLTIAFTEGNTFLLILGLFISILSAIILVIH